MCVESKNRWKKIKKTAYNSYKKVGESELDNIVSEKDKIEDIKIKQLQLEVHDTYEKDEKITTKLEPQFNGDALNKAYLDTKLSKIQGRIS